MRALWARSALSTALLRSNLRDSHFQTGGIATDYMPQIYTFFILAKKKMLLAPQKIGTAFPVTKVGDSAKLKLVLFGTYYREGTDRKTHLSTAITTKWKDSETVVLLRF